MCKIPTELNKLYLTNNMTSWSGQKRYLTPFTIITDYEAYFKMTGQTSKQSSKIEKNNSNLRGNFSRKGNHNRLSDFAYGVISVGKNLIDFGDYLGRVSGFRDYQNNTNYYQNNAIRQTKYTYKLGSYIAHNDNARKIFWNATKKYISNNKSYFAGRFTAGLILSTVATQGTGITVTTLGSISNKAKEIDDFARQLILGE